MTVTGSLSGRASQRQPRQNPRVRMSCFAKSRSILTTGCWYCYSIVHRRGEWIQRPCLGHHERFAPRFPMSDVSILDGLKIFRNWYSSEYGSSRPIVLTDSRSSGTDTLASNGRHHRRREVQRIYIIDYRFVAQPSLWSLVVEQQSTNIGSSALHNF